MIQQLHCFWHKCQYGTRFVYQNKEAPAPKVYEKPVLNEGIAAVEELTKKVEGAEAERSRLAK